MNYSADIVEYAKQNQFEAILQSELPSEKILHGPNFSVDPDNNQPYPVELDDLVRLHKLVRSRKVTTILEFGTGFSTAIMADALLRNKLEFGDQLGEIGLRRNNPFELHAVETDARWAELTESRLTADQNDAATIHTSDVNIGEFNGRICHFYQTLPNICPDFIYLDGPSAFAAKGDIRGTSFQHMDRTVLSADILSIEWLLLPGCYVLVDGRTNNARFLRANFQREWRYEHHSDDDTHSFELIEEPLGLYNQRQLEFCLSYPTRNQ